MFVAVLHDVDLLLQFLSLELEVDGRRLDPLQSVVVGGQDLFHILSCLNAVLEIRVSTNLHRLQAHKVILLVS